MDRAGDEEHADPRRAAGTLGETVETLGRAEAVVAETIGELVGETTRAFGAAAARTADGVRPGSGDAVAAASEASARAVEATSRFAGAMLDAGGTLARDLADAAGEAAARGGRSDDEEFVEEAAPAPPRFPGPS